MIPPKTCVVCGRPFTWRKKWARCWDEVKYCSDACRKRRRTQQPSTLGVDRPGARRG